MDRLPKLSSWAALVAALASGACGDGDIETGTVALPDEEPVSYTERSAHNPDPPPPASEPPIVPAERPQLNVFGPSGPGPVVSSPAAATPAPANAIQSCVFESDACEGCTTQATCCDCFDDDTLCEALCGDLP